VRYIYLQTNIYRCRRRKGHILGGHSIPHSKQKKNCICICVLFQMVSELFALKINNKNGYYVLFLIPAFIVKVRNWYSLLSIIHFRKLRHEHQYTLQLLCGHGILLISTMYSVHYIP
jgi:uncharacterized membrane protein